MNIHNKLRVGLRIIKRDNTANMTRIREYQVRGGTQDTIQQSTAPVMIYRTIIREMQTLP